jgi:hypothetical protein
MSEWRFSDGTVVESNGEVTGDSEFAAFCAYQLARAGDGIEVGVPQGPEPAPRVPLKLGDDDLMAAWLLSWTYTFRVRLLVGPQPPAVQYQDVKGRVY